jgi:hypothetical protein
LRATEGKAKKSSQAAAAMLGMMTGTIIVK